MINYKTILVIGALATIPSAYMSAQTKQYEYKLKGEVTDSVTRQGEPYATLSIVKRGGGDKPLKMAVTNADGKFSIDAKGEGDYVLIVRSMGRNEIRKPFTVEAGSKTIDLGKLLATDSKTELKGVEVVAYKPLVKADIDKLAYSVEDDPESKTNTVMEMLKKVPMVSVDGQDNIKVNGSTSFKIYVNGKPNNMMTNNPKEVLKSMPASSIKKVEVITNPGPKYDAEGVGGILNIITEGKGPEGYTATLSLRGSTRGGGGGAFATVKKGKLTVSANYNNSYDDQGTLYRYDVQDVLSDAGDVTRQTIIDTEGKNHSFWQGGSVEASYDIDSLRLVTGSLSLNRYWYKSKGFANYASMIPQPNTLLYGYDKRGVSYGTYDDISGGIDYQRSFKVKDRLLTFSYRIESNPNKTSDETKYIDVNSSADWAYYVEQLKNQYVDGNQYTTEHTFQLDYTTPFAKHHTLETGAKYILRQNKAINDKYDMATGAETEKVYDEENSSHYKHRNDIFAAYLGYGLSLTKWSARLGLRYEHTLQDVKYLLGKGSNFRKNFDDLVPSAKIGYKFTDMMNISLNYKMRISRPGIWYLNPYIDDANREQISQGNPNLDSEKTHSLELQFGSFGQKLNYNISASYNRTNNSIQSVQKLVNDKDIEGLQNPTGKDVFYTTYYNIGKMQSAFFSGYASWNPLKNTRFMANVWGGYTHLSDGQSLKNHGWQVSFYVNAQQTIAKTWNVSMGVYKNTPSVSLQGTSSGFFYHDISINKKFLDDRLTIGLSAGSPFKKYFYVKSCQAGQNFAYSSTMKVRLQQFSIAVSYRLGKLESGVKKAQRTIDNDDVKQGGKQGGGNGAEGK